MERQAAMAFQSYLAKDRLVHRADCLVVKQQQIDRQRQPLRFLLTLCGSNALTIILMKRDLKAAVESFESAERRFQENDQSRWSKYTRDRFEEVWGQKTVR